MKYNNIAGKPVPVVIDGIHWEVPLGGVVDIPDCYEPQVATYYGGVLRSVDLKDSVATGGETRLIVDTPRAHANAMAAGEQAVGMADKNTIVVKDQSLPGPATAAITAQSQRDKAAAYNPDLATDATKEWVHPLDLAPESTHVGASKTSSEKTFPNLKVDPEATGDAKKGTGDYEVGKAAAVQHIEIDVPAAGSTGSAVKAKTVPPPAKK